MHLTTVLFCCLTLFILQCVIVDGSRVGVKHKTNRAGKKRGNNIERFNKLKRRLFLFQNELPVIKENGMTSYELLDLKYYETLYDTTYKLAVYSAYTIDLTTSREHTRISGWIKNPLLNDSEQPKVEDYKGVSREMLDGGHLFPQFYNPQENEKRFSNLITNIALQYSRFNQNTWKRLEEELYDATKANCNFFRANNYFVTGVIPSDHSNMFHGINIPKYFWTAVCCDSSVSNQINRSSGWSFAYIVKNENTDKTIIDMYFIEDFLKLDVIGGKFESIFKKYKKVEHCLFSTDQAVKTVSQIQHSDNKDMFIMHGRLSSEMERLGHSKFDSNVRLDS